MTRQLTQIIAKPCCMKLFMAINVTHFADRGRNEFLDPNFLDETSHRAMLALQFALAQQAHSSRDLEDIRAWLSVRVALNEVIAPEIADYLGDIERNRGNRSLGRYPIKFRRRLSQQHG